MAPPDDHELAARRPDRTRFLAAKTLAFAAAGALLSIGISIAIAIAGYAILGARDLPTPSWAS